MKSPSGNESELSGENPEKSNWRFRLRMEHEKSDQQIRASQGEPEKVSLPLVHGSRPRDSSLQSLDSGNDSYF